ncbi:MAG: esterase-like activity of phytase family protein [Sphingomonadaceae bacterium]
MMLFLVKVAVSLAAFGAGAGYGAYAAGSPIDQQAMRALAVEARAVPLDRRDPARDTVGRLRYLGGLALTAPDQAFGGISSLFFEAECGRLLGVTDNGSWIALEPDERDGRLVGVRAGWIAALRDEKGEPPPSKREADAEAVTRDPKTGEALVWFELDHRVQRYADVTACRPETFDSPARAVERPVAIRHWPANGGVEAAAPHGEEVLVLSERAEVAPGWHEGLLFSGTASRPIRYPATDGFEATGLAELEPGLHILVARRFSLMRGVAARVSLFRLGADGRAQLDELARLAPPLAVDNMEGIAARREGGRNVIYLVSDDNFNPLQRTLLLKFEILP